VGVTKNDFTEQRFRRGSVQLSGLFYGKKADDGMLHFESRKGYPICQRIDKKDAHFNLWAIPGPIVAGG
jgi:hypothetical protein